MKKILAIALAVLMIAVLAVPAFAADVVIKQDTTDAEQNPVTSGKAEIKYGVDQTYTVTLPSEINFGTETAISTTISASDVVIAGDKKLVVTIASENAWTMVNTASSPVAYGLFLDATSAPTYDADADDIAANGATVLEVASSAVAANTGSETLWFATKGTSQAGQYSDNLTFTITVADANNQNQGA